MKSTSYSIQAGHFKSQCLRLMDEVNEKHVSIIITKHGKPVAKLIPIDDVPLELFGCLKDTITIKHDIVSAIDLDWEVNE